VQNQPDPRTPVGKRRWLDRLRAAWDELQASPRNTAKARALETIARERPQEASYRMGTFSADAALRASSTPPRPKEDHAERDRGDSGESHSAPRRRRAGL
jgi:hypothetical protein